MMKGTCEFCGGTFEQSARNQKICSSICAEKKKNTEANQKWLERKPRKKNPVNRNNQIEMSRTYPAQVNKRYQAVRG